MRLALCALPLVLLACSSSPPPKVPDETPVKAPEPTIDEPKSDDSGSIDITCNPPVKVKVDGKEIGESPITKKVTPGRHEVTCDDEEGPRSEDIDVGPSESKQWSSNRTPKIQESQAPEKPEKPGPKKK